MVDEEHRAGDWQRKEARRRVNEYYAYDEGKKWYNDTFWIVVLLIAFWPVGGVLMWRSSWPIAVKIGVSILLAVVIYATMQMSIAVRTMGS